MNRDRWIMSVIAAACFAIGWLSTGWFAYLKLYLSGVITGAVILGLVARRRGRWIPHDQVRVDPPMQGNSLLAGRSIVAEKVADAFPGFGGCLRCTFPWTIVRSHTTHYVKNDFRLGCFPLCQDCWLELQNGAQRMPYYMMLVDKWAEDERQHVAAVVEGVKFPSALLVDYEEDRALIRAAVESGL